MGWTGACLAGGRALRWHGYQEKDRETKAGKRPAREEQNRCCNTSVEARELSLSLSLARARALSWSSSLASSHPPPNKEATAAAAAAIARASRNQSPVCIPTGIMVIIPHPPHDKSSAWPKVSFVDVRAVGRVLSQIRRRPVIPGHGNFGECRGFESVPGSGQTASTAPSILKGAMASSCCLPLPPGPPASSHRSLPPRRWHVLLPTPSLHRPDGAALGSPARN